MWGVVGQAGLGVKCPAWGRRGWGQGVAGVQGAEHRRGGVGGNWEQCTRCVVLPPSRQVPKVVLPVVAHPGENRPGEWFGGVGWGWGGAQNGNYVEPGVVPRMKAREPLAGSGRACGNGYVVVGTKKAMGRLVRAWQRCGVCHVSAHMPEAFGLISRTGSTQQRSGW